MKNDGERLLKIIRDKIPMMTEEELRQMTRMLQKIKIEHLPEMKENGILSREIFFPELTRLKAFDGVEKCSFGRWLQWKDDLQSLLWLILREENGRMLLLSDNIIEWMPFQRDEAEGCSWESSSLRARLNGSCGKKQITTRTQNKI